MQQSSFSNRTDYRFTQILNFYNVNSRSGDVDFTVNKEEYAHDTNFIINTILIYQTRQLSYG